MFRLLAGLAFVSAALAGQADWVPARWPWTDPQSLELLKDTPVNCLLVEWKPSDAAAIRNFAKAAAAQNLVTLAVIHKAEDAEPAKAGLTGIVFEAATDSPPPNAIPIVPRARMNLSAPGDSIIGTNQGVWPGVRTGEQAHAGPSAAAWIDTNSGFLRFARAASNHTIWIANLPPQDEIVTPERYMQVIADAAMTGARWVLAFDPDFRAKLAQRDERALRNWKRIVAILRYYEDHKDWRNLQLAGQLAIIQDAKQGALVSGGILDMIATKHTPIRPITPAQLTPELLKGRKIALDIDSKSLTPGGQAALTEFTRAGGTLLTGPPEWRAAAPADSSRITLTSDELKRVDEMWKDMSAMIGRQNLGVRLFNVASMLSNFLATPDRKQVLVELVNYSDYPVENVTMHVLGTWTKATLILPNGEEKKLEVYPVDEGTGVDLDSVGVVAAVRLE